MKAERAEWLARLAVRFGCSVPEVRAMTQREVKAWLDVLEERDRASRNAQPPRR